MAATITAGVTTADTTTSPNVSGAFTPAENDTLIVFVSASNTTQDPGTISNSQSITFTQFAKAGFSAGATQRLYGFISDTRVTLAQAVSQTVTANYVSDDFGGTVIGVALVAGLPAAGITAVRQFDITDDGTAAGTPDATFASAVLTGNPTLFAVANETNPAGMTPPTNWTEGGDAGYATPTSGMEWAYRNSGFTGTTITAGGTSASAFCAMAVELVANVAPTWDAVPSMSSQTATAYTIGYDASASATNIYLGAYPRNATAPTAAELKAGTGAHGTATEATTGSADSLVLTPSDTVKSPWYDIYGVLEGAGGFSSVEHLFDELLDIPAGENRVTLTSVAAGSFAEDISATVNDIITWVIATDPGAYVSTISASGQVSYAAGGDDDRQTGLARRFIDSTSTYANSSDQYQWVVNNLAPVPVSPPLVFDLPLLYRKGAAITAIDLRTLVNDPESDTVVVTALTALPAGTAITASVFDDTGSGATAYGDTVTSIQFADQFGDTLVESATFQIGELVPDVVNVVQATAITNIAAVASMTATVDTSEFSDTIDAGKVKSQSPAAGTLAPYNQEVLLTISLGAASVGAGYSSGMVFDANGRLLTHYLLDAEAVPEGAQFHGGIAYDVASGGRYICAWPADNRVVYRDGAAIRQDGAQTITAGAIVQPHSGVYYTARGELCVTTSNPTNSFNGFGFVSGKLSVTSLS